MALLENNGHGQKNPDRGCPLRRFRGKGSHVIEKVYLLWFVEESKERGDLELLIGIYKSEPEAKAAIDRLSGKPGFADNPSGFQIHPCKLGKDDWTEGFIRDRE